MEKEIIVTQGKYVCSAVKRDQYPANKLPEIVFMGRSNVGKSSLINSLTRTRQLARVSSQPGKTQTINFFEVGVKLKGEEERKTFHLVDLPGYGYAKTGRENRKIWAKFIEEYLTSSEELRFVCQLMDIRHEPMASDLDMLNWLMAKNIPVLIVATKADKLSGNGRSKQLSVIRRAVGIPEISVLPYSSLKNDGRQDLLEVIYASLE
ncbi:MAG TPA: YihA family ribosome biogenesis GTP-binding protein [Selenomonas sp.]|nr:YihA family ribosome biogenesis GTP-binding protein [Selenomonas sp.]